METTAIDRDQLITQRRFAALVDLSADQFRDWVQRGLIGPLPVRTHLRTAFYREREVRAWIAAGMPPRDRWNADESIDRIPGVTITTGAAPLSTRGGAA